MGSVFQRADWTTFLGWPMSGPVGNPNIQSLRGFSVLCGQEPSLARGTISPCPILPSYWGFLWVNVASLIPVTALRMARGGSASMPLPHIMAWHD